MGSDIPQSLKLKLQLEKKDSGVDGVFVKEDDTTVAYQVKFRKDQNAPAYDDLTSFWAESEHADERCIFANCYELPKQAYKKKNQFCVLRDCFSLLDETFFDWLYEFTQFGKTEKRTTKYKPFEHQKKIISDVLKGFETNDRGEQP